jgi:uncharacterized FlaG/YvyC family protein
MESGSISKPIAAAAPVAPARSDHLVAAGAVKTELAPEAAVQQVDDSAAVQFAPSQGADFKASIDGVLRQTVERMTTVDPRTQEVVFRAISKETGVVVRQVPDETMLRFRAYLRELVDAIDNERSGSDVRRVEKIA